MYYNDQPSPTNNWSSNVQYQSYHPDRVRNKKKKILDEILFYLPYINYMSHL
jgi:hypothetical protein